MSWPKAEIQRMMRRSMRVADFEEFRNKKICRFTNCFLNEATVSSCINWTPCYPISAAADNKQRTIYVVVPWHPAFGKSLSREIVKISERWSFYLRQMAQRKVNIRVVWSNAGKPLFSKLRAARQIDNSAYENNRN